MTDTISLNEARAKRDDNCMMWEPLECAKAFLRDVEGGQIKPGKLIILYTESDTDLLDAYYAKVTTVDIMAMLWGKLWRVTQRQWP